MLVVIALGGNALLRRGEPLTAENQRANVRRAAAAIAEVIAAGHRVVICHGNGPQVGLLALQAAASPDLPFTPRDALDAESEGLLGYVIGQEIGVELGSGRVATLLTQTVVDASDPAFAAPTKPIGPVMTEREAARLAQRRGWTVARDGHDWRRVVPSPWPQEIVEIEAIRALLDAGIVPICAGGGGVPVVRRSGRLQGVEAVVDKDLASALLAELVGADLLLLLTDVAAVQAGFGTPDARDIELATPTELDALDLATGSMGPKAAAASQFVRTTHARAAIGALCDAVALAAGTAGTQVVRSRATAPA
jgi:carbamate kinase